MARQILAPLFQGYINPGTEVALIDANFNDVYGTQQTTDPTVSNDSTQGYGPGSVWVNTTAGRVWRAISVAAGAAVWVLAGAPSNPVYSAYNTAANTTGFTATGAQISGGLAFVCLDLTGTLGAGAALTLPIVANLVTALGNPQVGQSYSLRVINRSSAAFNWTVTTNTGWGTLNGLMTVAQNTFRDFTVTLTSLSAASLQTVGTGVAP